MAPPPFPPPHTTPPSCSTPSLRLQINNPPAMATTWIESGGSLDLYDSQLSEGFWTPGALAFEAQTLTRALQVSISSPEPSSPAASFPASFLVSDSDSAPTRRAKREAPSIFPSPSPSVPVASGRIAKRRQKRVSKRTPITYIEASPANFREMVQQITGIQMVEGAVPSEVRAERPRPAPESAMPQGLLPTLDTSAFLLNMPAEGCGVAEVGDFSYFHTFDPFEDLCF